MSGDDKWSPSPIVPCSVCGAVKYHDETCEVGKQKASLNSDDVDHIRKAFWDKQCNIEQIAFLLKLHEDGVRDVIYPQHPYGFQRGTYAR